MTWKRIARIVLKAALLATLALLFGLSLRWTLLLAALGALGQFLTEKAPWVVVDRDRLFFAVKYDDRGHRINYRALRIAGAGVVIGTLVTLAAQRLGAYQLPGLDHLIVLGLLLYWGSFYYMILRH